MTDETPAVELPAEPVAPVLDAPATPAQQRDAYIAALLRERDGLIARGLGRRVSEIEAELERVGFERVERATVAPKTERATKKP